MDGAAGQQRGGGGYDGSTQLPYGGGAPPFGWQTPTAPPRIRPRRPWYLAALVLLLAGIAWLGLGLASLNSQVSAFPRVPLPAGGRVTLAHSGGYVVYFEARGASSGPIPTFNVRIVPASAGALVGGLTTYAGQVSYTFGSRQGRAVLSLQVARPGTFLVEAARAPRMAGGSALAFGPSIAGRVVALVLPTIGLILLGATMAIVVFVLRLTRTRRARAHGTRKG